MTDLWLQPWGWRVEGGGWRVEGGGLAVVVLEVERGGNEAARRTQEGAVNVGTGERRRSLPLVHRAERAGLLG